MAYSLGNFLFPQHGTTVRQFLGGNIPTKKEVKEYLDTTQDFFSLARIGHMLKVTVDK